MILIGHMTFTATGSVAGAAQSLHGAWCCTVLHLCINITCTLQGVQAHICLLTGHVAGACRPGLHLLGGCRELRAKDVERCGALLEDVKARIKKKETKELKEELEIVLKVQACLAEGNDVRCCLVMPCLLSSIACYGS